MASSISKPSSPTGLNPPSFPPSPLIEKKKKKKRREEEITRREEGKENHESSKTETTEAEEESDDDDILEESPCGRWNKRREEVKYRDVPGVDAAYLAMDTEEGVEVVWNEASFSETKKFKAQEDKLKKVFEALTLIGHPNIVKFHRFWMDNGSTGRAGNVIESSETPSLPVVIAPAAFESNDKKLPGKMTMSAKPRLIFITEYMSSGSLKQFLRRTKKNARKTQLASWKRWCVQILSALRYLHLSTPSIIHGNLTCDTIFIQHNGLVKIGSVAPDIIHQNVKTCRDNIKNLHYLAPEYGDSDLFSPTTAMDIYAFGMAALEMAALEIQVTDDTNGVITDDTVQKTIQSLEDELQQDFIRMCLLSNPSLRPSAHQLLFHPVLFEVHSLKLLAAHVVVNLPEFDTTNINEIVNDKSNKADDGEDTVLASMKRSNKINDFTSKDLAANEKLEKFIEDVKNGIYPITAFGQKEPCVEPPIQRSISPQGPYIRVEQESHNHLSEFEAELRRITMIHTTIYFTSDPEQFQMSLLIKLEDAMNRQLYCPVNSTDTAEKLAKELVSNAFINESDYMITLQCLEDCFSKLNAEIKMSQKKIPDNTFEMCQKLQRMQEGPEDKHTFHSLEGWKENYEHKSVNKVAETITHATATITTSTTAATTTTTNTSND